MGKSQPRKPLRPLSQFGTVTGDDPETPAGIACFKCGCKMWVVDTDPVAGGVRRYRVCRHCGRRKVTFER